MANKYMENYYWLKEHGVCVACRGDNAISGRVLCADCAKYRNERYRLFNNSEREHYKNVRKARYWDRRKAGVCVDCGSPLAETSSFFCIKHLQMKRVRENRYRQKRRAANANNVGNNSISA